MLTGVAVTLDGSASSDADKDQLSYRWQLTNRPAGSAAALSAANIARPTFVPDVAGEYLVQLVVNDGKADSAVSVVRVMATVDNAAPVARVSQSQEVATGATVSLDGGASSDANGDALQFAWTFLSRPAGSSALLVADHTATPTFVADVAGAYQVQLIVSDGKLSSEAVVATVNASTQNVAPVANAGAPQTVGTNVSVQLDASASSDADGDPLTYLWGITSKPEGSAAKLSSDTAIRPNFVADKAGDYVVSLVVNDGKQESKPTTTTITAAEVAQSVALYEIGGGFIGSTETLRAWPYASGGTVSASVTCVGTGCDTTYELASFKLKANGGSYTIANLTAVNATSGSPVAASFEGLRNGQTIAAGQTVDFTLRADFTKGRTVNLKYAFTIKETGERFSYNASLKTN